MAGASLMFLHFWDLNLFQWQWMKFKTTKNIPKGIIASLTIVTILYVSVTLVLTGIVHYSKLNVADAVAFALRPSGFGMGSKLYFSCCDSDSYNSLHFYDFCFS